MKNFSNLFPMSTLILFVFIAFTSIANAEGKIYKVGMSLAITGPTSDAGNPISKGVEDWFKYANETRLLGEDRIDYIIRDDQYSTDVTKRNFEEYMGKGIVFYLNYSTGSTLSLKRDFEEVQMPVITASYHEGNLADSNYVFLPVASYSENTVGLAEYVVRNHKGGGVPKIAFFVHPSAFGRGPLEDTLKAVDMGLGIEIVEVVEHGRDLDNSAMLKRLLGKGVQYVISNTVQSPVATMLKDAQRLGIIATSFGQKGKLTFLGAHYTGGSDLIALAGNAAEGFLWTCSYNLTSEQNEGAKKQIELAKRYHRNNKAANSHNYATGILMAQIPTEIIRRAKSSGMDVNQGNLYKILIQMNGNKAFSSFAAAGPVTYSKSDHIGVDQLQVYQAQGGVFKSIDSIESAYMKKIRQTK